MFSYRIWIQIEMWRVDNSNNPDCWAFILWFCYLYIISNGLFSYQLVLCKMKTDLFLLSYCLLPLLLLLFFESVTNFSTFISILWHFIILYFDFWCEVGFFSPAKCFWLSLAFRVLSKMNCYVKHINIFTFIYLFIFT